MSADLERLVIALADARLEAIFLGDRDGGIDLLVRDTPLHRERLHVVSRALGLTHVPLSEQARTITLVGAAIPIQVIWGQLGAETYAAVRARAIRRDGRLIA